MTEPVTTIGTLPELYPINKRLFEALVALGMEGHQALLYILETSVIFEVADEETFVS